MRAKPTTEAVTRTRWLNVPSSALIAIVMLLWLAGAAVIRRVCVGETGAYGLEQSAPGTVGDPVTLIPALTTIPFAIAVGWALCRSSTHWPIAILASGSAVAVGVLIAVFILMIRFARDETPVGTFEIELAWFLHCFTAVLHALTTGAAAWRFR